MHPLSRPASSRASQICTAGGLIVAVLATFSSRRTPAAPGRRSADLWLVLAALSLGLWLFGLLRITGLARWPLARAESLEAYLALLGT